MLGLTFLALRSAPATEDRIAAYGLVSPGDGVITVALPSYQGTPPIVGELLVKPGDRVTKGQKLAVTRGHALARADLAVAQAHLATAHERLAALTAGPKNEDLAAQESSIKSLQAEADAEKARKAPDTASGRNEAAARLAAALARVSTAQHQLAALREVRPADLALARAETDEAAAAVARAEAALASVDVTSPIDAQVLSILTHPGESGAGLVELADTGALVIKAELNAADAFRVKPGARATIRSEAWTGELTGAVARVDPRVSRSKLTVPSTFANVDRHTVEATITLDTPEKLAALTGAEVTVLIARDAPAR